MAPRATLCRFRRHHGVDVDQGHVQGRPDPDPRLQEGIGAGDLEARLQREYALLKSYPVCRWSGQLGPKNREGDRQVPEGFYTVTPAQMNPNSNFYLSFDTGYPNAL